MSDLGIYQRGDTLPGEWFDITPSGRGPFARGSVTFGCDTEATFKDGWLRLHAIERGDAIFVINDTRNANIHFNNDMRMFDCDGRLLGEVICSPGAGRPL